MKKTMLQFALVLILAISLVSCYPGDDVSVKDMDTTSTFYKKSEFTNPPKSAIIYWDVAQLKGEDGDDIEYNGDIDDEILNTTLDNLVKLYGVDNVYIFTQADIPYPTPSNSNVKIIKRNDPIPQVDAAVIPSIILRENTSVGVIYPRVSSYGVGTVILTMDTTISGSNEEPSWTALMRGLLSSSNGSSRTISGINKAFEQSPYLN